MSDGMTRRRVIVGMTGASGVVYAIRLLEALAADPAIETHLIMSPAARQTIAFETDWPIARVEALADVVHRHGDIAASISSGSFRTDGMVIVPCSIRTLAAVAWGLDDNLIARAADVTLKERRRLLLCVRETPLHLGHLRSMTQAAEMGASIVPLMPGFYGRPGNLDALVDHMVGRILDQLDIVDGEGLAHRWRGGSGVRAEPPSVD